MTKKNPIEFETDEQQFCAEILKTICLSVEETGYSMEVFMEVCFILSCAYLIHEKGEAAVINIGDWVVDAVDEFMEMEENREPKVWH